MNPNIFRQSSLEKMSSPEQFDVLMTIARPRHWIALLSVLTLLAAFFAWAVLGTVTVKMNGNGVLTMHDGLAAIAATSAGQVTDIGVKPGDTVRRGDTVARLFDPSWPEAGDGGNSADNAQRLLLKSKVVSLASGRVLKVLAQPGQWVQVGQPLITLEAEAAADSEDKYEAVVYVPMDESKALKPGTPARVWPNGDSANANGAIIGEIAAVSQIPAALDEAERATGNRELAAAFIAAGPVAEVRVALQKDPGHPTRLRWTARRAESGITLKTGMLCSVQFITGKTRPIEWIF
ncbi:HlyD family efflux transporter periplasmic adaptor subunit [Paenibacillus doosanensis]|uniref:HlyD family efflux transporter periplasmic adaptor subunit n=1 Tax=Paenibacillus doosanensis TaxID=1229154 RepID=UPI00217F658C|nr:HlyD family efflux transporter periplasmic adaptor subunit [Paenibacillus doosanensis]MCS7462575.1 HlyD family efflux transporter periplasmic adaptor subunit [Paenibacillus doosanensis]